MEKLSCCQSNESEYPPLIYIIFFCSVNFLLVIFHKNEKYVFTKRNFYEKILFYIKLLVFFLIRTTMFLNLLTYHHSFFVYERKRISTITTIFNRYGVILFIQIFLYCAIRDFRNLITINSCGSETHKS